MLVVGRWSFVVVNGLVCFVCRLRFAVCFSSFAVCRLLCVVRGRWSLVVACCALFVLLLLRCAVFADRCSSLVVCWLLFVVVQSCLLFVVC